MFIWGIDAALRDAEHGGVSHCAAELKNFLLDVANVWAILDTEPVRTAGGGADAGSADRFDEIRRKWIARHQYTFIFQKRRAESLARQIRDRDTERTGARVDPADDDVIHPWFMRPVKTPYAMLDWAIFMTAGLLAPLGWPAGKILSKTVVELIPGELRSYPVAAFMVPAAIVGVPLALLYEPGDSLVSAAATPWLLAQVPATLLTAGIYGILEGWLAVDAPATGGR